MNGKAHAFLHFPRFGHAVGDAAARRFKADARHGVLELQAVFGLVDGLGRGADQLALVFVQHTVATVLREVGQGRNPAALSDVNCVLFFRAFFE